jgi:hypothetical protein
MKVWKRSSTNPRLGAIFQKTFYVYQWVCSKVVTHPTQHSCFLNKCQQHKLYGNGLKGRKSVWVAAAIFHQAVKLGGS